MLDWLCGLGIGTDVGYILGLLLAIPIIMLIEASDKKHKRGRYSD